VCPFIPSTFHAIAIFTISWSGARTIEFYEKALTLSMPKMKHLSSTQQQLFLWTECPMKD